jgi:2-dehydro-3-deoxyphosphogluconate aldolase/(4S)-4-hydroxy-2-oxoglutarate aldolase
MVNAGSLRQQLSEGRVLVVLRTRRASQAVAAARVVAAHGFTLAEVSLTTAGACTAISAIRAESRGVVGAGTVTSSAAAEEAVAAGAQFLVTPALLPEVHATAERLGVPVLAGAYTPTEVLVAWRAGAAAVKVFPASSGGPAHIAALRGPFPEIPLVPVGGIEFGTALDYLAVGALAVGLGSQLIGDDESPDAIDARAGLLRAILDGGR